MTVWKAAVHTTALVIGGVGVNTFHVEAAGAGDPGGVLNDWIDALEALFTQVKPNIPGDARITFDGQVQSVDDEAAQLVSGLHTWAMDGGTIGNALPSATAIVIGWRTHLATRSGRGRTFLNPLVEATLDVDGQPKAGNVEDIEQAAEAYIAAVAAIDGLTPVVWSPTNQSSAVIQSANVRKKYAVLRSRRD